MFRASSTALLLWAFLPVTPVVAQQADCRKQAVPVSVYSVKPSSARQLSGSSFVGNFGGKSVEISAVATQHPHRVALILDTSGSMLDRLVADKDVPLTVAKDLLMHMPPDLEIGAVFFNDKVQKIISPTVDHQRLSVDLQGLEDTGKGRTALWDAIRDAARAFVGAQPGDVFYAITDGDDNQSRSLPHDVVRILNSKGIRLFAFELKHDNPSERRKFPGDSSLEQMVEDTGGFAVIYSQNGGTLIDPDGKPSQMATALQEQYRLLLTFDLLAITLPETPHKMQSWKLAFSNTEPEFRDLRLRYPKNLVACE